MTISFNSIPEDVAVPLFWAEMDNSQANTASGSQPSIIFGHPVADSSLPVAELVLVSSVSEIRQRYGAGSQIARMVAAYRAIDSTGPLWAISVPEPEGTYASGEIMLTGQVINAGVISLYIGKTRIQTVISAGDDLATVAANLADNINTKADLPVDALVDDTTVTLTAKNVGLCGNGIPLSVNYYGSAGGEHLPDGVMVTLTPMAGGEGAPDLTEAVSILGDEEADFIAFPYSDSASLDAIKLAMNDTSGRWAPGRQTYGHVYSAMADTLENLQAFGAMRNDQHVTLSGFEIDTQTCTDELAAMTAARNAVFIRADPARPTQTGELNGALPAPAGKRFNKTQQNVLLGSGIATCYAQSGGLYIQRAITTYQMDSFGNADNSYLDSETLHTSAYVLRTLETCVTSKYPRVKLANDGTRFGPGQAIVTPAVIKAEMCAQYQIMEEAGIVENFDLFKQYLVVERDKNDSNRVNVLFPADYINQLRVFALVNQFRLQYQEAA
ncbi:phage tail sheath subtilisin-like domain-containing protein [Dryocola sp. LX212]